jgi:magnesium chelatase family protein
MDMDMSEVQGQEHTKRALEVAAAGGHHLVMIGPPGSGKTVLAGRLATILPRLSPVEVHESSEIHRRAGLIEEHVLLRERPFRAPHHTASDAGLVGGSNPPRPGEVSLAHNGILLLDELPEFKRHVLEVLRELLEKGTITRSSQETLTTFPASFMLVASMNPCPCGFYGTGDRECTCSTTAIERYRSRAKVVLDQIDIRVELSPTEPRDFTGRASGDTSGTIRARVIAAREIQERRYAGTSVRTNGGMTLKQIYRHCELDARGKALIERAIERLGLSARAYARILKVARTIADIAGESKQIEAPHIAEAIGYVQ